ncbi:MAG: PQQ-binding-like beta-propeller repeat protein [Planctomycetales bacterium]|nr:PQQ-binding-like beta-propeller repeat protein [Planctomycetales bacterium]
MTRIPSGQPLVRRRLDRIALLLTAAALTSTALAGQVAAEDWPMWRYDAARGAASPEQLPGDLRPLWTLRFEQREQVWDDPLNMDLMTYDRILEPIVADGRLMVSLNDRDQVAAFDTATGQRVWTHFAEAPVRLPPVAANGRAYYCSDDGYLYCVEIATGKTVWRFRGAPGPLHAIGNHRLVSAWPARGGPVLRDGTVYFAASIWPFMGTFLYALDADTGEVQWVNDSTSAQYIKQPHSAPSFAGVAPQGALVATDKWLLVPGGRSVPAVFRRDNGAFQYYELNAGGKGSGGSFVAANEQHFFVHTRLRGTRAFQLENGVKTAFMPEEPVLTTNRIYAYEPPVAAAAEQSAKPGRVCGFNTSHLRLWEIAADASGDLILAGDQLIAGGQSTITALRLAPNHGQLENQPDAPPTVDWKLSIEEPVGPPSQATLVRPSGPIERLLVADGKLFVVTATTITAYGNQPGSSAPQLLRGDGPTVEPAAADDDSKARQATRQQSARLLDGGDREGYAFWFGDLTADRPLLEAIATASPFTQLAVVDRGSDNGDALSAFRNWLHGQGLYGRRVTAHAGTPASFAAPHYVAHQVFVSDAAAQPAESLSAAYRSVRPYGGTLHLLAEPSQRQELAERVGQLQLEQAKVEVTEFGVLVRRVGALPGSADWTHQYGDIANSIKSRDERVRLPLGLLWFGGSSNMDVLPRHGHGPPEQVVGGRLFIEGMNSLSARDVYTGRVLWKRSFEDLGTFGIYYDKTYRDTPLDPAYNQVHIPGANGRGANYVVTDDRVYLLEGGHCLMLDPANGKTLATIELPRENGKQPQWAYLGVYENVLIGGLGFANYGARHDLTFPSDKGLTGNKAGFASASLDTAASRALVGFDRHSGKQLWRYDAKHSFWHNGVVAGGGRIYCLDRNPKQVEEAMKRRGLENPGSYRIVALDYRSGKPLWEHNDRVFGSWLGYSEPHNLLLQAGAAATDRLAAEPGIGMAVHHADTGSTKWRKDELKYAGPCILHNEWIITNANSYAESAGAFRIDTGEQKLTPHPLTGELQPWTLKRAYGCNNIIASEHLLTFRSGAAGFYDLTSDSGTGNLGGFKSGCTSNLVVANGVLNAPDYTRTCSCSYQNQTSLALVHMPEMEMWTVHSGAAAATPGAAGQIQRLGLNFGAPGDRRDDEGTLWLDYPVVGGDSPPLHLELDGDAQPVRRHASVMSGQPLPWVLASGVSGVKELRLKLHIGEAPATTMSGKYRVRMLFTSPSSNTQTPAPIRFDVYVQGERVLAGAELAGSSDSSERLVLDREFPAVTLRDELRVRIVPTAGGTPVLAGLSLISE